MTEKERESGAYAENNPSHLLRDVLASWWWWWWW